jgi:hypothetical protein
VRWQIGLRRTGTLEHAGALPLLVEQEFQVLSHYVAGLSVECMLHAYKFRTDPHQDQRHDLMLLAKDSRFLDLFEGDE